MFSPAKPTTNVVNGVSGKTDFSVINSLVAEAPIAILFIAYGSKYAIENKEPIINMQNINFKRGIPLGEMLKW